jgi:hypothetical protein
MVWGEYHWERHGAYDSGEASEALPTPASPLSATLQLNAEFSEFALNYLTHHLVGLLIAAFREKA